MKFAIEAVPVPPAPSQSVPLIGAEAAWTEDYSGAGEHAPTPREKFPPTLPSETPPIFILSPMSNGLRCACGTWGSNPFFCPPV
jgi:hypothetical protein